MQNEIQSIYSLPIGSQREHNGLLLTLTEDGWRAEVQHSMHRRCKGWDYCKPWTYLITLLPQGIPEDTTYKPYKELFNACANGQLLLLSPWKFEPGVSHLARWQCLFLNDTAMQLSAGMAKISA